jgi:CBS-domain-containing membrane protein
MVSTIQKSSAALTLHAQLAADLMTPDPISIRAEASANEVMSLFTDKAITAAPVIDQAGRPIGVVSRSDLLVHQVEQAKHRAGGPDYQFEPTQDADAPPVCKATVADLMTPAVFAVSPDTPVGRVVNDMVGLRVHHLFVVDDAGVLVGVISTMDVLKHLKAEE